MSIILLNGCNQKIEQENVKNDFISKYKTTNIYICQNNVLIKQYVTETSNGLFQNSFYEVKTELTNDSCFSKDFNIDKDLETNIENEQAIINSFLRTFRSLNTYICDHGILYNKYIQMDLRTNKPITPLKIINEYKNISCINEEE